MEHGLETVCVTTWTIETDCVISHRTWTGDRLSYLTEHGLETDCIISHAELGLETDCIIFHRAWTTKKSQLDLAWCLIATESMFVLCEASRLSEACLCSEAGDVYS